MLSGLLTLAATSLVARMGNAMHVTLPIHNQRIEMRDNYTRVGITPVATCVQFTVGAGTGCAWMCDYCANQLGTFNYYFPDGVCTYQTGGCVGNPQAGHVYSCCAAGGFGNGGSIGAHTH